AREIHWRSNSQLPSRHFQSHPFSRFRQRPNPPPTGSIGFAELDKIVTPKRAMLPIPVVPLHHDFARWIFGIQIYVGEERILRTDMQRFLRAGGKVLELFSLSALRMRSLPAEHRPFRF